MEHADVVVIGGGQSGLATAHALLRQGLKPVILEASGRAAGSWPRYYDSLTLFSPARYSSLPGMPFGGDPDRHPHRDEVTDYLTTYAARLNTEIRTNARVEEVRGDEGGFKIFVQAGSELTARVVVAASGTFGNPYWPALPGLDGFTGTVLHAAEYASPEPFSGQRIVVVGAGNSAVQIAAELADIAQVTLATRTPVRFARQHILGRDLHFWLRRTGLDTAPLGRVLRTPPTQPVLDDGRYRAALNSDKPDQQTLFTEISDNKITWPDGTTEQVDTIILATGYRPDLPYLDGLGALDQHGHPLHRDGASLTRPGLAYVGLEWLRSLSSNSLRGVGRDAERVARRMANHLARS
ncbi:monooxygenase [Planotetraspora thailandica]|uniref:Monooxygenase n=1 Tax=Planotetraspora thailandica TaxID=487172 RepID=A0A8J3XVM5_9ACTN|nr:NAD(P)/FAD-dependent oxidoreductase [Planotetraspora thailandica]GII54140.1 monooxygenase [Planotetraspora thailandica]